VAGVIPPYGSVAFYVDGPGNKPDRLVAETQHHLKYMVGYSARTRAEGRWTVQELIDALAERGIINPLRSEWRFTFPNGRTISTKLIPGRDIARQETHGPTPEIHDSTSQQDSALFGAEDGVSISNTPSIARSFQGLAAQPDSRSETDADTFPDVVSAPSAPMCRETFDLIKERHGGYASWAVWARATDRPKSNVGDLSVLDPDRNSNLLKTLRNDLVMLALNPSRAIFSGPVPKPFYNFHDPRPRATDYKIRYAFEGTDGYGAYMTDLIKTVVMPKQRDLDDYLDAHPEELTENVEWLLAEFEDLGCDKPTLIVFGQMTSKIITRSDVLPRIPHCRLITVTHYAHRMSPEDYRNEVVAKLAS
jgi:hypothetical protein